MKIRKLVIIEINKRNSAGNIPLTRYGWAASKKKDR